MTQHTHHKHCAHDLKFCEKCDRPYCTKCDMEWFEKVIYNEWYKWLTQPTTPYTTGQWSQSQIHYKGQSAEAIPMVQTTTCAHS